MGIPLPKTQKITTLNYLTFVFKIRELERIAFIFLEGGFNYFVLISHPPQKHILLSTESLLFLKMVEKPISRYFEGFRTIFI